MQGVDGLEAHDLARVDQLGIPVPALDGLRDLGERPDQHPRGVEEPPPAVVPADQHLDESARRVRIPRGRLAPCDPIQESRPRPGTVGDPECRIERERDLKIMRRLRGEIDHTVVDPQPARRWHRIHHVVTSGTPNPPQARAQERRRRERGDEHHEQQRGIEVTVEDALGEADRREDQTDLAAGEHPEPDQELVARSVEQRHRRHELADHRDDGEDRGDPEHARVDEPLDLGGDPDLEEEHGNEEMTDRREITGDALTGLGLGQRKSGDERPDDRRELRGVGELGEREGEGEGQRDEGARGPRPPLDRPEQHDSQTPTEHGGDDEEPDREQHRRDDGRRRDSAVPHDLDDDGQEHQAEHVVRHRGAHDRAGLDRGERTQVAEDPGRDPDARRREGGAEKQGGVGVLAERETGGVPTDQRDDDPDDRDAHRGPTDGREILDVHLHAHLQQEQDHAELGEYVEDARGAHEPQQRRADEDPGHDLADDSGDLDPFRDLGGELGRHQDHQDVTQDLCWRHADGSTACMR